MTQRVIITKVVAGKEFAGRDGVTRRRYDVYFKIPFANKAGQVYYDNYAGAHFVDATDKEHIRLMMLQGKEVQIVAYFNVREVQGKNGPFPSLDCHIREIYDNDAPQS